MEKLYKLMCLTILMCTVHISIAQESQVTGKVTDESDGTGLPGVSIVEKGTANGTVTDIDGNYSLSIQGENSILVFSSVGFTSREVIPGSRTTFDLAMKQDITELGEIVVTALGIERDKRALGYAVQDVKADELMATSDPQVMSALQGKVAGLNINSSGSGAGGSSRIQIRGASSLSGNNSPLWVVDGIPFDNSQSSQTQEAGIWGGTETAGGAFDINPNDIESVSVLKGPNAAALYGSRAGNGVIIITTKKGSRDSSLGINYSNNFTWSEAAYMFETQDQYGQGSDGIYNPNSTVSWGPKFEGQSLESWTGETIPYEAQTDRIKDFTRIGASQYHNISFSGGNDKGSFRTSIGRDKTNGIYEGHEIDKTTFDFKADYDVNDWLNIDTKFAYFLTEGKERPGMGYYSITSYFNAMPVNIRNEDLAPGYDIIEGNHVEKLYTTPNANFRNPYFLLEQESNKDERNRVFGYMAANIKFTPELKLNVKHGIDFYRQENESSFLYADNVSPNRPAYNTYESFFKEENSTFLLSYTKEISDFEVSANIGGQRMVQDYERLEAGSGLLPDEGNVFLGYGTNVSAREEFRQEEVQSLYGFAQLGYKYMLYLDVTGRNDWSSTLPINNNSYFYPSVSLSAIISEMATMPSWLDFAKVRASWAQVGKATTPYSTSQVFTVSRFNFNLLNGNIPEVLVNENLKPEISSSLEAGLDLRLFTGRIGVDFTIYDSRTENQILEIATDQSAGYQRRLINAGLITNKGIELMLKTTPIKINDFSVDLNFNFARNRTLIEELDEELKEYRFGALNNGVEVVGIEGEMMGDIKGRTYERNEAGDLLIGADGLPIKSEERSVIGNIQPDWTGSVLLGMNYKGFSLNALVSVQQGGDIFSSTEQGGFGSGTAERTTANNRISSFVEGVTETGETNNVLVSAQEYWGSIAGVDEEFIYDASFVKLRELAITYSFSKNLLGKIPGNPIKRASLSVVGRNLWYFHKNTPGTVPDASSYSSAYEAQAFDFSPVPSTRTYGFSLNIGF